MAIVFNEFLIEVAKGKVKGHRLVHINGHDENLGTGAYEDLWPLGGTYTDSLAAAIHYISSGDAGDTGTVRVWYLDANWTEQIIDIAVVGQTKTQIGTGETMIRVLKAEGYGGTVLTGPVYIYEDDTVVAGVPQTVTKIRAYISGEYQTSMMAKWAIPASKSGVIVAKEVTSASNKELEAMLTVRLFGKNYVARNHPHLFNSNTSGLEVYPLLPEKTDIKYKAQAVSAAGAACSIGMSILLIDNTELDLDSTSNAAFAFGY